MEAWFSRRQRLSLDNVFRQDFMATQPVEEEVWSHVAVTWDGSEATMFINGKEAEGSPISGGGVINVKDEPSASI